LQLDIVQVYNLALGVIANASVEANVPVLGVTSQTWGPVIETSTATSTTTMAQACANSAKPQTVGNNLTAAVQKREDLTTTILNSEVTASGVSCMDSSEFNCPVSMQRTTKSTYMVYHTTAVDPGATPIFPATTVDSVHSRSPFGTCAQTMRAMSGSPTAYNAPPTPSGQDPTHPGTEIKTGSKSTSKHVGIGVGVGLGMPLMIAVAYAIL
jgi:predicted metal-binding protein